MTTSLHQHTSPTSIATLTATLERFHRLERCDHLAEATAIALDTLPLVPQRLTCWEEYDALARLKTVACGLTCDVLNRTCDQAIQDRWHAFDRLVGKTMFAWVQRWIRSIPADVRLRIRYLIWKRIFNQPYLDVSYRAIVRPVLDANCLYRVGDNNLAVVGVALKVGDNVFTVDHRGREHRRYLTVCAPQAFPVSGLHRSHSLAALDGIGRPVSSLPVLPDRFEITSISDNKYAARGVRLSRKDQRVIAAALAETW